MHNKKIGRSIVCLFAAVAVGACAVSAGCAPGSSDEENTYSVTLDYNDGYSRPGTLYATKGQSVSEPDEPFREGYAFDGWYTAAEGGTSVQFPYTPDADSSIYAHWAPGRYEVTFDFNYDGAPAAETVEAQYMEQISAPDDIPERDNYVFRYWTLRSDGGAEAAFPYTVRSDTVFYASWRDANIKVYTVTFDFGDYDGAPEDSVYELEDGERIARAPSATRQGYELTGWQTESGDVVAFPYIPQSDVVLTAVWEEEEYRIRFMSNYPDAAQSIYSQSQLTYGEQITAPSDDPQRSGYTFSGWYTADVGGNLVTFPVAAERNATYYAHWTSLPVTTDIFHAEYVYFDPNQVYPGASGDARGAECIVPLTNAGIAVDNYPANSTVAAGQAFAVNYQYTNDARLVFEITASREITGASLIVNWATERDLTFGPTGENAYVVTVNGQAVNYSPVTLRSDNGAPGVFNEFTLATNITLHEGVNTIVMQPNNNNSSGTMQCSAPITDYIRLSYNGTGLLSWRPVYDNINNRGM